MLQSILNQYKGCILEKYETPETASLQVRDADTCMAGNQCTLASRVQGYSELLAQAGRGDPTNVESKLKAIMFRDCMNCSKHKKWHTKPGITMELDTERAGNDYSAISSRSPAACRESCQRDARCRAYTYVRQSQITQPGVCSLKSKASAKSPNVNAVSGVK